MSSADVGVGVVRGAYPERDVERLAPLDELAERLAGPLARRVRARRRRWDRISGLVAVHGTGLDAASDPELVRIAGELRVALRARGFADDTVARSFALVREVARRSVGQRHFDVQLVGGWVLLHGMVAEMDTGEGKTLTATLPACTAALAGVPVHVVTVNDYLARRDAERMGPVYRALGLSVGLIVSGMDPTARRAAYACDVTYCTNKEVAFDYLKDRIALGGRPSRLELQVERIGGRKAGRAGKLIHRGLHFAIVDEADSVLVDEARTPLIISDRRGDPEAEADYRAAVALARELELGRDFEIEDRERRIRLREPGCARLAQRAAPRGGLWLGRRRREELVRQALTALHLFQRDQQYLVRDEKVQIVDEYTGRIMGDRSWEHGLHQLIEVKENVPITGSQNTRARISYQRFFRRYLRLAGMTGTAREVASELWSVYRLPVVTIPANRPPQRRDLGERVTATEAEKWSAVARRATELHRAGRPVLVGTRSVESSEILSARLQQDGIPHQVLNARQDRGEAELVARAGEPARITVATNMAGRGTDIALAPGVAGTGGLHVIASERHDSRRIDRQLFGRCGRQGDPGSFEAIVSLQDELVRLHAGALGSRLAAAAAREDSNAGRWLRRTVVRHAQRAAGRLNSRMRRELLHQDTRLDTLLAFSGRPE